MSTWICLLTVSLGLLLAKQLASAARDVLDLALSRRGKIKTAKQGKMVLVCDGTTFRIFRAPSQAPCKRSYFVSHLSEYVGARIWSCTAARLSSKSPVTNLTQLCFVLSS